MLRTFVFALTYVTLTGLTLNSLNFLSSITFLNSVRVSLWPILSRHFCRWKFEPMSLIDTPSEMSYSLFRVSRNLPPMDLTRELS